MKRCPECRRDYYDETLLYCLDDGTALLDGPGEPVTALFPERGAATGPTTSEGPTRTLDPSAGELSGDGVTAPPLQAPARNSVIAGIAGLVLVTALGVGSYLYYGRAATKQIDSIAVMPFVNESGSVDAEYLSDGMTETLISGLSQLPNLSVKARSSVFRYKGKDTPLQTVGKELNVQAILNGRIVHRGPDLALHIELVDAENETVLWKADYNRAMTNLVSLQSEIARDVANKLRAKLSGAEQEQAAKRHTENAEAYQLYLRGRFHWNKRKAAEHIKAIQYFEQAIALDPNYALAYAGLADCYAVDSSPVKGPAGDAKLRAAANKAIEIDPQLGPPHAALANSYWETFEWDQAERELTTAIRLDPDYPTAHQWYAELLSRLGRHDEAIAEIRRALELDPLSMVINSDAIYILSNARRYDEAIVQARKTIEMDPSWTYARNLLGFVFQLKGEQEAALTVWEEAIKYADHTPEKAERKRQEIGISRQVLRKSGPDGYWRQELAFETNDNLERGEEFSPFYMAEIYTYLGEYDKAFEWLNKTVDKKDDADLIKVYPSFEKLHGDPRWPAVLKRMNMTP